MRPYQLTHISLESHSFSVFTDRHIHIRHRSRPQRPDRCLKVQQGVKKKKGKGVYNPFNIWILHWKQIFCSFLSTVESKLCITANEKTKILSFSTTPTQAKKQRNCNLGSNLCLYSAHTRKRKRDSCGQVLSCQP